MYFFVDHSYIPLDSEMAGNSSTNHKEFLGIRDLM
jgi:hypothetical protein